MDTPVLKWPHYTVLGVPSGCVQRTRGLRRSIGGRKAHFAFSARFIVQLATLTTAPDPVDTGQQGFS